MGWLPQRRDEGFTLAELLVVMAVMGILAAIAIPVFTSQAGKARQAGAEADAAAVARLVAADIADGMDPLDYRDDQAALTKYTSLAGYGRVKVSDGSTFTFRVKKVPDPNWDPETAPSGAQVPEVPDQEAQAFCVDLTNADGYSAVYGDCSATLLRAPAANPGGDYQEYDRDGAGAAYSSFWTMASPVLMLFRSGADTGKATYVSVCKTKSLLATGTSKTQALSNGGVRATLTDGLTEVDLYEMSGTPYGSQQTNPTEPENGQIVGSAADLLDPTGSCA